MSAHAQSQEPEHTDAPHVLPVKVYLGVFAALLFFTVVTVGVSYLDLGSASIAVALIVALIKAAIVAGYFMHLKFDTRFYSVVLGGSIIFILVFFGFTYLDLSFRKDVLPEQGTFELRRERDQAKHATGLDYEIDEAKKKAASAVPKK
jgi:caa(3)-type oxidase subunit IV